MPPSQKEAKKRDRGRNEDSSPLPAVTNNEDLSDVSKMTQINLMTGMVNEVHS